MKPFSFNMPTRPETANEQLHKRVIELIKDVEHELLEEYPGDDELSEAERIERKHAVFQQFREELQTLLEDSSAAEKVLGSFDAYAAAQITDEEVREQIKATLLDSTEQADAVEVFKQETSKELENTAAELNTFLDETILEHTETRAEKSKWGFAKLDYEKGDPTKLKAVLRELVQMTDDEAVQEKANQFLHMLEHQQFEDVA